jgi:hypothetical protein
VAWTVASTWPMRVRRRSLPSEAGSRS